MTCHYKLAHSFCTTNNTRPFPSSPASSIKRLNTVTHNSTHLCYLNLCHLRATLINFLLGISIISVFVVSCPPKSRASIATVNNVLPTSPGDFSELESLQPARAGLSAVSSHQGRSPAPQLPCIPYTQPPFAHRSNRQVFDVPRK